MSKLSTTKHLQCTHTLPVNISKTQTILAKRDFGTTNEYSLYNRMRNIGKMIIGKLLIWNKDMVIYLY